MKANGKFTKENFEIYHKKNPDIYKMFVKFALMVAARRKYYSAKAIFHRMRWETVISGEGEEHKISDGYISHYARKFMVDYPQHNGFFKTKTRKVSYHEDPAKECLMKQAALHTTTDHHLKEHGWKIIH